MWGDGTLLNGGDGVKVASDAAHMSQQSIQDVLDTGATSITRDKIGPDSRHPHAPSQARCSLFEQWNDCMRNRANQEFDSVHDMVLSLAHPRMGHVSADISYFYLKVSRNGMEGYLGRGPNDSGRPGRRDHAARLRTRVDQGAVYYGTDDDKWLSVGTVGEPGTSGCMAGNSPGIPLGATTPKTGS